MFKKNAINPKHLFQIIDDCTRHRNVDREDIVGRHGVLEYGAPQWKAAISRVVDIKITSLH